MANDGSRLLLSQSEKDNKVKYNPESERFIKKLIGSLELIRGINKYCIWIEDDEFEDAKRINEITKRIDATKQVRLNSKRARNFVRQRKTKTKKEKIMVI